MNDLVVEQSVSQHVSLLRLNRPEVRNAINSQLLRQLAEKLEELGRSEVRVLVITGSEGSFSAGGDLKEIQGLDPAGAKEFAALGHRTFETIEHFPYPVVAAINGPALGGGLELACACDLRYAAASARLGSPEARVGMITGWGGTLRLPRYIGVARAKELFFAGRVVTAAEAEKIGLVNGVFPDGELMDRVLEIAGGIAVNAPIALRLEKRMLNRCPLDTAAVAAEEGTALAECVGSEDQTEGVRAFFEKREPIFRNR